MTDERLREIAEDEVSAISVPYPYVQEMARELLALREANHWIPVSERLPELDQEVYACFQGQFRWVYFVASMTARGGLYAGGYALPTHWRPLPSPPEAL